MGDWDLPLGFQFGRMKFTTGKEKHALNVTRALGWYIPGIRKQKPSFGRQIRMRSGHG